jgi:hypothetical protein
MTVEMAVGAPQDHANEKAEEQVEEKEYDLDQLAELVSHEEREQLRKR